MVFKFCPAEVKLCSKYEQEKAKRARMTKTPFFTKCRFGIADVRIPIIDRDNFLGSIVCGQPGNISFHFSKINL
ncbi:hypothetical protein COS91_08285 [Candidatus Desantisbacteria bacterium CG07_land_8_20_14_0_80_39_15]|uniref:PocR domain-containing protein n=1 Tax=Candidatus Desantisbacteria bacterium CG07_land_8_20_14_0_80_39_15 TaxID=1974549 RepID=A0A2M6ZE78_9BACT|nr:MAG: hypothetical protein COS91_08285 [Candidatus Desantisbacteria bacterium CG07_land_8_20_14_0_80_39_15]